jgi:transcriptional regulator with XRE-family HTH domain
MSKGTVNSKRDYSFVSPAHIRAARGWLAWNLDETQEKSGLSRHTINRYETGAKKVSAETLAILYRTFERAGVELRRNGIYVRETA